MNWLEEKVIAKLEGWKGNLLSQVGKEVLIKDVIQAIPIYLMAILTLPKKLCASLTSAVAKFWWKLSGRYKGIHQKRCEDPKTMGGLGFNDFSKMNTTLLTKHAWRLISEPSSYWASTLKGIYFLGTGRF